MRDKAATHGLLRFVDALRAVVQTLVLHGSEVARVVERHFRLTDPVLLEVLLLALAASLLAVRVVVLADVVRCTFLVQRDFRD